jgi:hypothetical protein
MDLKPEISMNATNVSPLNGGTGIVTWSGARWSILFYPRIAAQIVKAHSALRLNELLGLATDIYWDNFDNKFSVLIVPFKKLIQFFLVHYVDIFNGIIYKRN